VARAKNNNRVSLKYGYEVLDPPLNWSALKVSCYEFPERLPVVACIFSPAAVSRLSGHSGLPYL
jgi:hypothetical protein